ncbi:hypothetical protein CCHR01_07637 [Colletotrichum chrysophilum]|uniref:Ecp2 effector protein domain-containing protein n=1 Tax=Colletotrichum chrysophilum TaxID=1836956 RepID=A0AAD9EIL2_9PEZI|nr:hypothetical protein CCHR01_07637 [Colletotrichum chrysophilum]
MVNFVLGAVATLAAVAPLAAAAPAATPAPEIFSFAKWVDGIIANPYGDNLTPEEAVEAYYKSRNEVPEAASPDWDYGRVRKRATCNTIAGTQASVADAVSCINYLAGLGSTSCVVSNAKSHFCTIGNAQITGVTSGSIPAASSCNDVARGAGYIMDACTLKDNTVQGSEFAYGNGDLLVWIRKPE